MSASPGSRGAHPRPLVVLGAASVAENVLDVAEALGRAVIALVDETGRGPSELGGTPIAPTLDPWLDDPDVDVAIAIGHTADRAAAAARLLPRVGATRLPGLVHPDATVSRRAEVGMGSLVLAGTRLQADARIGAFCYLNANVVVPHGATVADHAALAPGAVLGGGVTVGTGAFVGINAAVLEGVTIGAWTLVGAGSVVTHDLPDLHVCWGSPARPMRTRRATDRYLR